MHKRLSKILLAMLVFASPVIGGSTDMIQVTDLRQEAKIANTNNLILVVEFSSEYCGFCRKLEDLFLLPMQRNAQYSDRVLIRSISLDSYETLIDFQGQTLSTTEFASRYDVSLTPTLIFLNAAGEEMSDKLVGIWSEDFYGAYIDSRIDEARDRLLPVNLAKSDI
jgi:thioredoxin-related protein